MVTSFEAVPFAQFHSRPLQHSILLLWDKLVQSLDKLIHLTPVSGLVVQESNSGVQEILHSDVLEDPQKACQAGEESWTPCRCREHACQRNSVSWSIFWSPERCGEPYNAAHSNWRDPVRQCHSSGSSIWRYRSSNIFMHNKCFVLKFTKVICTHFCISWAKNHALDQKYMS